MPEQDAEFIEVAKKRFAAAEGDEKLLRDEALIDLRMVAGDQWDTALKQEREQNGRPALTFPRCHTFVQQVSNEARQNKPQIKFAPDDEAADKDTAEIYEGLARHIQYASMAQIAYETAVEYSAGGSFGYYRFLTDYCDPESDELELKICPVLDPFAVYGILVPACFNREPKFGFVIEDVPKDEFEALYPGSATVSGWNDAALKNSGWIGTETVRIAEYWRLIEQVREQNKSGSRRQKSLSVKFCKMTGLETLPDTETTWPGYCIPIIPVLGKAMIVGGKPILQSVIRNQRGAQKMINYSKTRIAELLSTQPISPFMVPAGTIPKGDKKWENLNKQVFPYLEYNTVDINGKPAEKPYRDVAEPPIQALSEFAAQEIDDMKATAGIFDASLGQKSNETSSVAITNRQQQASMTTMHFMDNLTRSYQKGGDIMADVIPKVYDTERMIRILGQDEAPKIVKVNAPHQDANGNPRHYKIGGDNAGKYHVIVTMGRAFSTKRMESFDMMQQVLQGNPNLLPMIGDIFFRNSDIAGADQLAERFKKMLPPNLQDDDSGADPETKLQQTQAQLAQAQQHLQAINAYAQQLEKEKEGKVIENQGKAQIVQLQEQSSQIIAKAKLEVELAIAEINAKSQNERERFKLELDLNSKLHVSAHEAGMQAADQSHQKQIAEQQAAQASQSQASDQAHEQTMAAQTHAQTLEQQQNQADLAPEPANASS